MGLFDFLKKKENQEFIKQFPVDEETMLVQKIKTEDMAQFTMIPYQLNCQVHKFIKDGGHPFAWIEINRTNEKMAKIELEKINAYISQSKDFCAEIPDNIRIPIEKIMFHEYSKNYGYSRLMCHPYTLKGKISKYPVSLLFMTDLREKDRMTTGEIFYGIDGNILKGKVSIWNNKDGFIYDFATVGRTFLIKEIKSTIRPDKYGQPTTIYKFNA